MVFSEYMRNLRNEQQETIKELAKITMSSNMSVYRWINGMSTPPPLKQKVISEYLKRPIEELFPDAVKAVEQKQTKVQ